MIATWVVTAVLTIIAALELWRTRRRDAASRRPVRLSARGIRTAQWVPVWLDAVSGDPDRYACRGRGRLREVHRRVRAVGFGAQRSLQRGRGSVAIAYIDLRHMEFHNVLRAWEIASIQQLVAISLLVFLTWVNTRGVRTGALVQNTFTFAKVGALLGLVFLGVVFGHNPAAIARQLRRPFLG